MNLVDFIKKFPDNQACRQHLKEQREAKGIICKNCGNTKHYWLKSVSKWRCSNCKTCTNLKSGTIMECSNLKVYHWYLAIHLMTSTKKPFSACEMQRQLGLTRYYPVWHMMNKIRIMMGKRDNNYMLKGQIEVDDAAFVVVDLPKKDSLGNKQINYNIQKRGRGSNRMQNVLIMTESTYNPDQLNPNKKDRKLGYIKMQIMDDMTTNGVNYEINKYINKNAIVLTDGFRSYNKLDTVVKKHVKMVVPPKEASKKLPWVHTVIANAKRQLLGVHHWNGKDNLQNYLNEFCYKLNRRNHAVD